MAVPANLAGQFEFQPLPLVKPTLGHHHLVLVVVVGHILLVVVRKQAETDRKPRRHRIDLDRVRNAILGLRGLAGE